MINPFRIRKKTRVYTQNPYSYNFISLNKSNVDKLHVPTANEVITNPLYFAIGRSLGVNEPHDWSKYYDKVFTISEWAKERTGRKEIKPILEWVNKALKYTNVVGTKRVEDVYTKIKLSTMKESKEETTNVS